MHLVFSRGGCEFCAHSRRFCPVLSLELLAVVVEAEVGDKVFAYDCGEGWEGL